MIGRTDFYDISMIQMHLRDTIGDCWNSSYLGLACSRDVYGIQGPIPLNRCIRAFRHYHCISSPYLHAHSNSYIAGHAHIPSSISNMWIIKFIQLQCISSWSSTWFPTSASRLSLSFPVYILPSLSLPCKSKSDSSDRATNFQIG